jgi:HD domain
VSRPRPDRRAGDPAAAPAGPAPAGPAPAGPAPAGPAPAGPAPDPAAPRRVPGVAEADALAGRAHAGQVDCAGRPYIDHPRAVAALVAEHGDDARIVALLHDVVEDTDTTLDDLRARGYSGRVVAAVEALTRRPGEAYDTYLRRAAADPLARLVKLADNAHNSDPGRLALLEPGEAEELRRLYLAARRVLQAPG